jgi:hypothetical protein
MCSFSLFRMRAMSQGRTRCPVTGHTPIKDDKFDGSVYLNYKISSTRMKDSTVLQPQVHLSTIFTGPFLMNNSSKT